MADRHDTTSRRGLLRGLATLPLIGGGVALIGDPVRAAEPVTQGLLDAYDEWLFMERSMLCEEMSPGRGRERMRTIPANTGASFFHFPLHPATWEDVPRPSTRAAIVLSAAGCDWRTA